jgi:hypothetical protein
MTKKMQLCGEEFKVRISSFVFYFFETNSKYEKFVLQVLVFLLLCTNFFCYSAWKLFENKQIHNIGKN